MAGRVIAPISIDGREGDRPKGVSPGQTVVPDRIDVWLVLHRVEEGYPRGGIVVMSHSEIGGDSPCYQYLSTNEPLSLTPTNGCCHLP
jgi:hypothetical protein